MKNITLDQAVTITQKFVLDNCSIAERPVDDNELMRFNTSIDTVFRNTHDEYKGNDEFTISTIVELIMDIVVMFVECEDTNDEIELENKLIKQIS
jgi:hypothetical protein